LLAWSRPIDDPVAVEEYWSEIREIARQTDPELALAHHIHHVRRRHHRWYPFDDSFHRSAHYDRACEEFDQLVVSVLAQEVKVDPFEEEEGT
jgi:hypothetical protein